MTLFSLIILTIVHQFSVASSCTGAITLDEVLELAMNNDARVQAEKAVCRCRPCPMAGGPSPNTGRVSMPMAVMPQRGNPYIRTVHPRPGIKRSILMSLN